MSLVMLFPATFFAGGIIPVLARLTQSRATSSARETGRLYGLHTLGSALGGIAAGFVLLEMIGTSATLLVGAASTGASATLVGRGRGPGQPGTLRKTRVACRPEPFYLLVYGASGMLALSYEIVWARQLTFVLGNSTYAFALMGAVVLAGLGLGSLAGQSVAARSGRPGTALGLTEVLLGMGSMLPLVSLDSFGALTDLLTPAGCPWALSNVARLITALVFMLPSTVCMGATFPLMVSLCARRDRMGEDVGALSMANALGAAIGPVLASQLLFRLTGVTASAGILAAGSVLLGVLILGRVGRRSIALASGVPGLAAVLLLAVSSSPPGSKAPFSEGRLLFFDEGRTATVAVFGREWDDYRSLRINGVEEVPVDQASLEAFYMLGQLPLAYNPEARTCLVVALGGGITAGSILSQPVDTLLCVELCPALVEVCSLFEAENGRPDLDPRFELVWDDGRSFVTATGSSWDVIVCDATHPGAVDSWVLYTSEFYERVGLALSPSGIAAQWVPLHQLPPDELRRILVTWSRSFEHSAVHLAGGRHVILVGSARPLLLDQSILFATPRSRALMERIGISSSDSSYLRSVLTTDDLAELGEGEIRSNTDDTAPCQFLRRKVPLDPQATIAPCVAMLLSLSGGAAGSGGVRHGQLLYWDRELPGAAEILSTVDSGTGRRWDAVCLTSAAEAVLERAGPSEALPLVQMAIAADGSYERAGRLLERLRGPDSPSGP